MEYLISGYTDVGIRKATNQDSLLIQKADAENGKVVFAVLCDGMGGLAKGELASATLIRRFNEWFLNVFPNLLYTDFSEMKLRRQWETIILETNELLSEYSAQNHLKMGTTVVAALIMNGNYYIINVGDSRAYVVDAEVKQITKDQTYIQREMDLGRMTLEQSKVDPRRNVLLQCVGASGIIEPDFYVGKIYQDNVLFLCSDGFRHLINNEEIYDKLQPGVLSSEAQIQANIQYLIELNKSRFEEDNISVALVKTI